MDPARAAGPRADLAAIRSWVAADRVDLVVRELLDERDWCDARGDEIRRAGGE